MNFELLKYDQFKTIMKNTKQVTIFEYVPYGKRGKAKFAGFRIQCGGFQLDPLITTCNKAFLPGWPIVDRSGCYFNMQFRKVNEKIFREIKDHFMENPNHEIKLSCDFEYPA